VCIRKKERECECVFAKERQREKERVCVCERVTERVATVLSHAGKMGCPVFFDVRVPVVCVTYSHVRRDPLVCWT